MKIPGLNIHSLFIKLLAAFALLGLLPLIFINQLWYYKTRKIVYQNELESSINLLNQLNVQLENALNAINVNTYSFLFDSGLQERLNMTPISNEVKIENEMILKHALEKIKENNGMISDVSYISPQYKICSVDSDVDFVSLEAQEWYQEFLEYGKSEVFSPVYINDYISRRGTRVVGWIRRLTNNGGVQMPSAFLVEISHSSLTSFLRTALEDTNNQILIFDLNGNLINHPDEKRLLESSEEDRKLFQEVCSNSGPFKFCYDGNQYTMTMSQMATTGWRLVMAIDTNTLWASTTEIANQVTLITVMVLIGLVICAYMISRNITRPIFCLSNAMRKVEADQFDVSLPTLQGYDEVSILSKGFNNMLSHIRRLLLDIRREEEEKRDAELKMLQAQINPHFLYNTLNVIRWRAVMHNEQTISKMVIALIRLLEFSGKRTQEFVTIEKELEHTKSYVELIQYQYGDKFTVEYCVDLEVLHYYTIKFILQPLIENAIFHGIIPMEDVGRLCITIESIHEEIHVVVEDNGVGMEENKSTASFTGMGFSNVNERLCRYFGRDAALRMRSYINVGTKIDFTIPKIVSPSYAGGKKDA